MPLSNRADVQAAVDALSAYDRYYLRTHEVPSIYSAGVTYRRETAGPEEWQTIPYMMVSKNGDCEDLAAWRAAEIPGARPLVIDSPTGYHVIVRLPGGRTEDPSKKLGM